MFITAEGVEGCGKTTILKMVYEKLVNDGYNCLLTREPGGVKISEQIRQIILNKENTELDDRSEALLFAASRRQLLVQKIYPALKENKIVLCDRYVDSSLAYQGGGKKLGVQNVLNINLFATDHTLPDLTLLFDIDPLKPTYQLIFGISGTSNAIDISSQLGLNSSIIENARKYFFEGNSISAILPLVKIPLLNVYFSTRYL